MWMYLHRLQQLEEALRRTFGANPARKESGAPKAISSPAQMYNILVECEVGL
jgi:hypothetical protein